MAALFDPSHRSDVAPGLTRGIPSDGSSPPDDPPPKDKRPPAAIADETWPAWQVAIGGAILAMLVIAALK